MLKKILAKFLPLSIRIFSNRMGYTEGLIRECAKRQADLAVQTDSRIDGLHKKLCSQTDSLQKQVLDLYQTLNRGLDSLHRQLDGLHQEMEIQIGGAQKEFACIESILGDSLEEVRKIEKKYLYQNVYEAKAVSSFDRAYRQPGFEERFLKLIRNLNADEIAKIVCILQRQRLSMAAEGKQTDLYLIEEQEAVKRMKCYMENHIFKVSEKLFCYDQYLLPRNHFEASVFYYKHGIDKLQETSTAYIRGRDIVDAGGFYGDSVLILEELQPRNIYTFECIKENYNVLKETLKINHIKNCIAENIALGAEEGEVVFDVKGSQSNMHTIDYLKHIEGQEKVKVITLDSYVETNKLEVGLIKVDIEGAEQQFLQGAKKTIALQKPVMLISIYHNADDFFDIKPMIESWNLGYQFSIHKPCDYSVSREVLLICEAQV